MNGRKDKLIFYRPDNNFHSSTNTAYPYLSSPMMLLTSATDTYMSGELCSEGDFATQWAAELETVAQDMTKVERETGVEIKEKIS